MKAIYALTILFTLSACSEAESVGSARSGEWVFNEICIDDVVYLVRFKGYKGYMSVKFNTDSTVVTCV